jgi:hypothetical protein
MEKFRNPRNSEYFQLLPNIVNLNLVNASGHYMYHLFYHTKLCILPTECFCVCFYFYFFGGGFEIRSCKDVC